MSFQSYKDMNSEALDMLREISSIGTSHAASALSKFLHKEIRIDLPVVEVLEHSAAVKAIGNGDEEKSVGATLVRMTGEIEGIVLFLYDMTFANNVLNALLNETHDSFEEMTDIDISALNEVGNIIICAYINALSKLLGEDIQLSVPGFTLNMLGAVLTVPMVEYGYETNEVMYSNADFIMEGEHLSAWLLMMPDIESLNKITRKLGL